MAWHQLTRPEMRCILSAGSLQEMISVNITCRSRQVFSNTYDRPNVVAQRLWSGDDLLVLLPYPEEFPLCPLYDYLACCGVPGFTIASQVHVGIEAASGAEAQSQGPNSNYSYSISELYQYGHSFQCPFLLVWGRVAAGDLQIDRCLLKALYIGTMNWFAIQCGFSISACTVEPI